jgi:tRNA threonylcarbamoyl adenosine modification protein YeaZ
VAFETSSRPGSVALWTGSEMIEIELKDARRHACDLLPALSELLRRAGLEPNDVEAICIGIGPGSYTGLRVGVATALGFTHGTGALLRAVPSFAALAYGELEAGQELAIALDARSNGWYFASYRRSDGDVITLEAPCVLTQEELLVRIESSPRLHFDDGVAGLLNTAGIDRGQGQTPRRAMAQPRATAVAELGMRAIQNDGPHSAAECEPLYLRPFVVKHRKRR